MLTAQRTLPKNYQALAQQTFFNLMNNGWAADKSTASREILSQGYHGMPTRFTSYGEGQEWTAVDEWTEALSSGGYSCGTTTIWYKGEPVWFMQYSGWYSPSALHLLKAALAESYTKHIWCSGRGPAEFALDDTLVYINCPGHITGKHAFSRFEGFEMIGQKVGPDCFETLGTHQYHGGFMFKTSSD
jgi:hypothetical protein